MGLHSGAVALFNKHNGKKKKKKKKKKKTAKQAMQAALTKSILWSSQGLWNSYILKGFL